MLTNKILVSAGKVKPQDVDILLKGGGALDITSVSKGASFIRACCEQAAISSF
jgi:acetyl-CoA carboxylase carboxyltransferase component